MYFLRGSLPWQGLVAKTEEARTSEKQTHVKIRDKKISTSIEDNPSLCCVSAWLRFFDKPDYAYLSWIFRDLFVRKGFVLDRVFDWNVSEYRLSELATTPARNFGGLDDALKGIENLHLHNNIVKDVIHCV